MASPADIQALLRFLTKDARLPLASAMGSVKELQKASLTSPSAICKANPGSLETIFPDPKLRKLVINAAKRVSKKREASDGGPATISSSSPKRRKQPSFGLEPMTPVQIEESLELPSSTASEEELAKVVLHTNRAPLVLAFAVVLIKYTMPEQPVSSRLSLAQAVVSVNSKAKARSIGIEKDVKAAEEEGWGTGQPTVRIMSRDISILKRWGYDWKPAYEKSEDDQATTSQHEDPQDQQPPLWGLDLEAFRSSSEAKGQTQSSSNPEKLPIYTAESARAYLLKSFASAPTSTTSPPAKKQSYTKVAEEKGRNLGLLLRSLDLLFSSWSGNIESTELDRRAWGWYVRVRPQIKEGAAGWGEKGEVKLVDILDLRRY